MITYIYNHDIKTIHIYIYIYLCIICIYIYIYKRQYITIHIPSNILDIIMKNPSTAVCCPKKVSIRLARLFQGLDDQLYPLHVHPGSMALPWRWCSTVQRWAPTNAEEPSTPRCMMWTIMTCAFDISRCVYAWANIIFGYTHTHTLHIALVNVHGCDLNIYTHCICIARVNVHVCVCVTRRSSIVCIWYLLNYMIFVNMYIYIYIYLYLYIYI